MCVMSSTATHWLSPQRFSEVCGEGDHARPYSSDRGIQASNQAMNLAVLPRMQLQATIK